MSADHDYKHGGWKVKYYIQKINPDYKPREVSENGGRDLPETPRYLPVDPEAVYFVLRLDEDPHARKAALAYADSVESENAEFAGDIRRIVGEVTAE
jgi:hypothetical protein